MAKWTTCKTLDGGTYYLDPSTGHLALDLPADAAGGASEAMCWVSDDAQGWLPAKKSGADSVQIGGSNPQPIGERKTLPLTRTALDRSVTLDDLVMLDDINEGIICHTLRARHVAPGAGFYTSAGTILIALNPYEYQNIYTEKHIKEYLHPGNKRLPPHVFQVAAAAHTALTLEYKDQAILISGESGAGKTEATKHCLAFMAEVAGSDSAVETQVLQANPLLEAFGNAKTVRNNNSSRFGRWIEIHFDNSGSIASARIEQYLLEKSRVVHQAVSERSYHIFYMLCESSQVRMHACSGNRAFTHTHTAAATTEGSTHTHTHTTATPHSLSLTAVMHSVCTHHTGREARPAAPIGL